MNFQVRWIVVYLEVIFEENLIKAKENKECSTSFYDLLSLFYYRTLPHNHTLLKVLCSNSRKPTTVLGAALAKGKYN